MRTLFTFVEESLSFLEETRYRCCRLLIFTNVQPPSYPVTQHLFLARCPDSTGVVDQVFFAFVDMKFVAKCCMHLAAWQPLSSQRARDRCHDTLTDTARHATRDGPVRSGEPHVEIPLTRGSSTSSSSGQNRSAKRNPLTRSRLASPRRRPLS